MDPSKIYNPKTLSQLTKLSPKVDWDLLVTRLLPSTAPHQDVIIVSSPSYLEKLSAEVLAQSTQRTIQAYLLWRVINEYAPALSEEIRKPLQRLTAKLRGTNAKVTKPRWETCLDQVDLSLGFIAGRYFVMEKFRPETKARADEFVKAIKESFLNRLPELEWLDEATRKHAIEKVDALVRKVGYPTKSPNVMSPVALSDYYSELVIDGDDFFGNYLRGRQWLVMKDWRQAGKPTDKSTWEMTPATVNAYYNPPYNEIVFPAGILQSPFFSGEYPDYLNYGGIGAVVGHELSHSFDNNGRHFDAKGRLSEWWTKETLEAFEKKTSCFVDQYGNFTMEDESGDPIHVNGQLTLGENVADNGGIRQSYVAWKRHYDKNKDGKENMLLPGLENITPEQLFFINYGRIWCGKSTKAQAKQSILVDEHSPPKWRVIGALQNSKYFAEVFKCPAGSPMNPVDKCDLW
ncbi:hypothetical protein BDB00DRAFT_753557 [Zychaea mexicana]|uniref:uncharacterized protein n=1 Tax=Zychaea mexicana TaxID=64656 RepID=UPI0022FEDA6C|nr:uncharacterized protein BDB00DRAFT_753557 [Zychaea mexicana]KAI9499158.1 hypothetical protein BDB00DRAFT_753557 [Zychaea mexicana]